MSAPPVSATSDSPPQSPQPAAGPRRFETVGLVIIRVVIPFWILAGAIMKLEAADPGLLPRKTVLTFARDQGWNIDQYLAILITIEVFLACVMLGLPRFARPAAIAQMAVFAVILIGEMALGNFGDCGCLGGASPPPWLMLTIDGLLLVGACVLRMPRRRTRGVLVRLVLIAAITGGVGAFAWKRMNAPIVIPPATTAIIPPSTPAAENPIAPA